MKTYYIHIFANEDIQDTTCGYTYTQFKEVIESLNDRGFIKDIDYTTYIL